MSAFKRFSSTQASAAVILIRLSIGLVFFLEGAQKFIYPATRGVGRFEKIGFPAAHFLAPMVGCFEVVCGVLVLIGLATRIAAIPLVCIMLTALLTTKLPILLGHDLGIFHVRELSQYGFWALAHESRTDFAMLMGALFLLIVGAGKWSVDAALTSRGDQQDQPPSAANRPF